MKDTQQLQLLVCSANLGNEQPDPDSLAAWIPTDGACQAVLRQDAPYPVQSYHYSSSTNHNNHNNNNNTSTRSLEADNDVPSDASRYTDTDQFDMIVIGMQEATFDPPAGATASERSGPVIRIQVPVVQPILEKGVKKALDTVNNLTATRDHTKKTASIGVPDWSGGTAALHKMLELSLPSYQHVVSYQRGQMRLEVFTHAQQIDVRVLRTTAQNTGRGGLANKGGIVTELLVNEHTRLAFMTTHLEAHEGASKCAIRSSSLGDILGGTKTKLHDVSQTAHYTFVLGDLNFRTELPGSHFLSEEDHKARVWNWVATRNWQALNDADELQRELRNKNCLVGFQTLRCNFPPTFKVERQPGYQYIDKRRPSYTDRILWKTGHQMEQGVVPLVYEPIDVFASSDHKPIRAAFGVDLNDSFRMRPKLHRNHSHINLSTLLHRRNSQPNLRQPVVAHRDKLQLFVSGMACQLFPNRDLPPNPYLCLVSSPPDALQVSTSRWVQTKSLLFCQTLGKVGGQATTAQGWPRSSLQMSTNTPKWDGEEIHCQIQTHGADGSSLDLTGALLHLTIMNYNPSNQDSVVGTFTFNLVNLLRSCRRTSPETNSGSERDLQGKRGPRNLFRRSQAQTAVWNDPITSVDLDESICLNGMETGRIQCTIDAWWMDTAKALATRPGEDRRSAVHRYTIANQQRRGSNDMQPSSGASMNET